MISHDFKSTAILAAKQSAKVLLQHFGKKERVKVKLNKSLVGTADIEANKSIINTIQRFHPSHSILSEETGFYDNKSDYKWVIDPLDGTHNFLHNIPIYGTSIALEYKNEVVLGVMNFPSICITTVAEKNKGAFLNGKRIAVSNKKDLNHSFILFDFSYAARKEKIRFLEKFANKTVDIRNFGSAIYNLMLVACGKSEGFVILGTNEWDIAAGMLTVEEASGKVTNLEGEKWFPKQNKFIVSNGKMHNEILKILGLH